MPDTKQGSGGLRRVRYVLWGLVILALGAIGWLKFGAPALEDMADAGTAALGQVPFDEPVVELALLRRLGGRDVVGEHPHVVVLGGAVDVHRHLDRLAVVHLHVAGEPRLGRVGAGQRPRRARAERREAPDRERECGDGDGHDSDGGLLCRCQRRGLSDL